MGDVDKLNVLLASESYGSIPSSEREYLEKEAKRLAIKARRAAINALDAAVKNKSIEKIQIALVSAKKHGVVEGEIQEAEEALARLVAAQKREVEMFDIKD